ncbi:hypothetical protein LTR10_024228 [Elasticomyces elasticus]|uniref:Major facilitator superfamily (MFS) profile domain-containing protein n=1 Tax=Exophiala sideris TaxID=1016849 RepID=A0ABR0IZP5_9EURO|nr:hypothetical protein LTR10_024228 [Elasticomyces elasticus]KAK5023504.1 hypothetical protein LTS07_009379 [Exophiala sideris]KAK5028120.1 hypothetical protein LTR13_009108 [Exophiala sideris]KAK5052778.1 hypothetical protein LTR69_009604 [Exophiala sideris]KAK5178389.1 hypothetical protein LTR44_009014 [Eurotiomycetes sp. CCFEE 6388]
MATDGKHETQLIQTHHLEGQGIDDNPHRIALQDNPEDAPRVEWSVIFTVFFLGLSFVGPVALGFLLMSSVLVQIGTELGDTAPIVWMVGAWSIAASVSFSIAGALSDILVVDGLLSLRKLSALSARGIGMAWTEFPINIPWGTGAVIFANLLTQHASWRWIYYIAIIYSAISLVGIVVFYFPPTRPQGDNEKSRWQEFLELDWIGAILYASGLTVFLVGFSWTGQHGHAWASPSVIAPIVVGFVAFVASLVYDFTLAKNPLFLWELMRHFRDYTAYLVIIFVAGMIFVTMAGLGPQAWLYMFTQDPIQIGLIALPYGVVLNVTASLIPALVHKIGHIKYQLVALLTIQTVFVALYAVAVPNNRAAWTAFLCFGQTPFSGVTGLVYVAASLNVRQKHLGIATGLLGTFRCAGGSVGNAIFSTILHSLLGQQLAPRIIKGATVNGFPISELKLLIPAVLEDGAGVPDVLAAVPGVTPEVMAAVRQAFKDAYGYAFQRVFYSTIPFGLIAIVCALVLNDPSKYLTNHIAVRMHKAVLDHHGHDSQQMMEHGDAEKDTPIKVTG